MHLEGGGNGVNAPMWLQFFPDSAMAGNVSEVKCEEDSLRGKRQQARSAKKNSLAAKAERGGTLRHSSWSNTRQELQGPLKSGEGTGRTGGVNGMLIGFFASSLIWCKKKTRIEISDGIRWICETCTLLYKIFPNFIPSDSSKKKSIGFQDISGAKVLPLNFSYRLSVSWKYQ